MTWLRIDDGLADHPKLRQAGPKGAWLYVCALCYCARYLTDGFVPRSAVIGMGGLGTLKMADLLVDVKLWERRGDGWFIPDYLDYNPSRAEVLQKRDRETARRRQRDGSVPTRTRQVDRPPTPTPTPRPKAVASKPRSNGAGGRPSHDQTYLVKQLMAANPEWEGAFSWAAVTKLNQKWGQEQVTEALRAAALDAGAGIESLYGWLEHRCQQESRT